LNIKYKTENEVVGDVKIQNPEIFIDFSDSDIYLSIGINAKPQDMIRIIKIIDNVIDSKTEYSKDWNRKTKLYFSNKRPKHELLQPYGSNFDIKKIFWLHDGLELIYFNDKINYDHDKILYRFKKRIDGTFFIEIGLANISKSGISTRDIHRSFPINDLNEFERSLEKHYSYKFEKKTEKFYMDDLVPLEKYVGIDYDKLLMDTIGGSRFKNNKELEQNLNYFKTELIEIPIGAFKCYVFTGFSRIRCHCQFESTKPGLCTNCSSKFQPVKPGGCVLCKGTGQCRFCKGADKKCLHCRGTGLCDYCNGRDICIPCSGTGICYYCKGSKWSKEKYDIKTWFEVNTGIKLKTILKKDNEIKDFEYLQYIGPRNILDQYRIK
jgi:hypothetical protein